MQPQAGAEHPHTHPRPVHWITTAAAVAAVIGGAALIQSSGAAASDGAEPPPGPDAGAVRFPVDCAGQDPEIVEEAAADFDHDGRTDTVAVVRCPAGSGTPPSGVYVIAAPGGEGSAPGITETLLEPRKGLSVGDFTVTDSAISATLHGYSSPDTPRCCPDKQRKVTWHWEDGRFQLTAQPVPGTSI